MDPKDSKNYSGVEDTYRKKNNEITSMNTFRKLVIELLGEEQAGELIDELLSLTIPERTFYSEKPDGKLLGLAINNVEECFFDQNHLGYTLIHDKKINSYQIIKLKSEEFKLNLSKWFIEDNNGYELARNEHKIQTIDTLMSVITKKPFTLYDRSVWMREQNMVYYNNDESSQIVKIIPDIEGKFEIVKQSPEFLLFRKLQDKCKKVSPSALTELEPGRDYLEPLTMGLKNESQKLIFKCWLISLYFNSVSYPIIYATGPERNGKTTMLKRTKSLFDPIEDVNNPSVKERTNQLAEELKIDKFKLDDVNLNIWKSSFTVFDNVSRFTPELEDNLCQWVTGSIHSKRKLYDDTDMIEIGGTRPIAVTGITNVATRPDFIARIVKLDVEVDKRHKKLDDDLWTEFYKNKPEILAYIFKIVSKVLANYNDMKKLIKVGEILPDFELLCEIISRCLGNKPDSFRDAWAEIRDEQVDMSLNNSLVGIVLENYLREQFSLSFEDTNHRIELKPAELYSALDHSCSSLGNLFTCIGLYCLSVHE